MVYKITRDEPPGPLRTGLAELSEKLPPAEAALFDHALLMANQLLDVALTLEQQHKLGDTDHSIPKPQRSTLIERQRGTYSPHQETPTRGM